MPDREQMMKRQQVLADFGEFSLCSEDLDEVLTEACRLVGEALGTRRAKILEIQQDGQCLLVRAGVGWDPDIVGQLRLPMSERSSETFAIKEGKPVITQDIRQEERFEVPKFMKKAGVMALANVPIFVPGRKAYGLLQVDATEPREFGNEDVEFLRTYTTILGPVIDRLRKVGTLRSSEERFRLVVENARDYAIFTTDPEDRITDWYPGAEFVFGWKAREVIGQPAAITFTPEDREAGEDSEETANAAREGSAPNVRWHLRKDGTRVFIEGMTTALHHPDGSLRGFLKIGQDVTKRRAADRALRESEERFRAFVTASSDVVYRMSSDWSEMQELEGRGFLYNTPEPNRAWMDHYIHPDDQPVVQAAINQAIRTKTMFELEHRVRRADGSLGWTDSRAVPLLDEQGEITAWFGAASDVTDRKLVEEALRESEARFRAIADVVPECLWRSDPEGRVTWFNERWFAYTGQSPEEAQEHGWLDTLHPDDRERCMTRFRAAMSEGKTYSGEYRIRAADGQYRWFLARAEPLRDGAGRTIQIFGAATDIHDLRELQEQQSVIVAELQHRTRNLITVVRAIAQQTLAASSSLQVFRSQFNDRLSALSRVQGLLSRADQEPITIRALIQTELDALGADHRERIVLEGPAVTLRKGSVQTLALAVHELATNAQKYGALSTEPGQLTVRWRVHVPEGEGRRLALDWYEQGIRLPEEEPARRGYGRELIERALPYVLQARTRYELGETELRCSIDLPLTARTKKASP
ncbi:PAS domain S-box protein [Methylobacterium oxalidis]|nr:PAS domain S-box protein [Methylobacterium oxalidis]GEP03848.1 hypothetical protein MOX02_18860 [Methylobacterium oxalidis]GJE31278.1 hypothetical protein LDDCCGHA_1455 [Methylobacterium oxalidis]